MIELSNGQQKVIDLLVARKNMFITGGAGSGKSFIVQKIGEQLKADKRTFALTASTGVSALTIGGRTLHSFAGLQLAKDDREMLLIRTMRDKKLTMQWKALDVLIVDEVSMIDISFIEKLEFVVRNVRGRRLKPFGGLQVILVGDFLQLPPIDTGPNGEEFLFESKVWTKLNLNIIHLVKIFRQKDEIFQKILANIRKGKITRKTVNILTDLNKDKEFEFYPTKLFATNREVDEVNYQELEKINEPEFSYTSSSEFHPNKFKKPTPNDKKNIKKILNGMRKNCPAEETVLLKVGSQVMLLINDHNQKLFNGSRGEIVSFDFNKDPVIRFSNITTTISRHCWNVRVKGLGTCSYTQMPIRLAWACSIHKSQSLSIDYLEVDIKRVFENSQAYVALSRATSLEGLRIINFDPSKIFVHSKVIKFYKSIESVM
jgi:ATP-dependent DNA helicase PIF1